MRSVQGSHNVWFITDNEEFPVPKFTYGESKPHTCPVCGGKGMVNAGFYAEISSTTGTCEETCRPCNGTGVLWGRY